MRAPGRLGRADRRSTGARPAVPPWDGAAGGRAGRERAGQRPVLVLSHDVFNERSGTVIAVALTSQPPRAGFPLTLELPSTRLPKPSWVKISQIHTLAVERIGAKLGRSTPEEISRIVEGLNEIIGP